MKNELYLVDTSAWIEFLRPHGSRKIREHIISLISNDRVVTSGIVKAEILQGAKSQKEYEDLERRLGALRYFPLEEALWAEVSRTAFQMRRKGFGTPVTDLVIAVTALREEATVVHADKHFDELSKVTGLKVRSYVSEVRKQ